MYIKIKPNRSNLIIKDKIYGKFIVNSPLLIELINSQPFQRLKKISQYGVPDPYYHLKNYSRFEHSIGVFLLLKMLNANEEEQIAGLLHDISHTAFSHVVDWVIGDGKSEEFQNEKHENYLLKSEVADILKKYSYDPKKIANHQNYKLLEQELPNLCVDRIDYSIREFPAKIVKYCIKNMINYHGLIVFKNKESALLFAKNFLKRQMNHWGGFEAASRYRLFANILKNALNEKIIEFNDFWKDDNYILNKINNAKNKKINTALNLLKQKSLLNLPKSREVVYKKFRFVDPKFLNNGKVQKLSKIDLNFKKDLESAKIKNSQGITIPKI